MGYSSNSHLTSLKNNAKLRGKSYFKGTTRSDTFFNSETLPKGYNPDGKSHTKLDLKDKYRNLGRLISLCIICIIIVLVKALLDIF